MGLGVGMSSGAGVRTAAIPAGPLVASSVGYSEHNGATSYTKSATIAANANRKLFVCLATDRLDQTVSNVRWGGSGGTALGLIGSSNNSYTIVHVYSLAAPASGTDDLYFETSTGSYPVEAVIVVVRDADQGAVTNTNAVNAAASDDVVCTLTGTSGSLLLLFSGNGSTSGTLSSADTTLISNFVSSNMINYAGQVVATGSSQSLTSTKTGGSATRHAAFALEVAAA